MWTTTQTSSRPARWKRSWNDSPRIMDGHPAPAVGELVKQYVFRCMPAPPTPWKRAKMERARQRVTKTVVTILKMGVCFRGFAMIKPPKPNAETAHDILRHRQQPLDVFFSPQNVAVIGATER